MKIHCSKCLHNVEYTTEKKTYHYCLTKDKFIPQRHYDEGMKKCGSFKPVKEV